MIIKEHREQTCRYLFCPFWCLLIMFCGCSWLDFEKELRERGFRILKNNVTPIRLHIAKNLIVDNVNDLDIIFSTEPQTSLYVGVECIWYWPLQNNRGLLVTYFLHEEPVDPNNLNFQIVENTNKY